ncbi:copper homeostasis protein [Moniliophthora roreri MCA 2997]|uniref:Copper homeostasis protein cutC homolog n=1 Tax=Moniliophthora roreri (strain MCA 2997) TaxID=1381753 RepID=V2XEJ5_MONRO|nr:copper homeostasis protein [Moniliophthora roreri MCA 2997]
MNVTTQPGRSVLLEVCVDSVESALHAARGGAHRLELCSNLGLGGGTTPSLGLLRAVQKALSAESFSLPIMTMVRPRVGDFLYSEYEIDTMVQDIEVFKASGAKGVVFGVLTAEGRVDVNSTKRLVEASLPLEVCFHRAFDMTVSAKEAFRDIMTIGSGVTRILTRFSYSLQSDLLVTHGHFNSGQTSLVTEALPMVKELMDLRDALDGPIIMPGSGVNAQTAEKILASLYSSGLSEIHMSGGGWIDSRMAHQPEGMCMGVSEVREWCIWRTSNSAVREVRQKLDSLS